MKKTLFVILSLLFFFGPVLVLVAQSLTETWRPDQGLTFQLDSYAMLWSNPNLWESTWWSLLIGGGVVMINVFIGVTAGRFLAFSSFKGKAVLETLLLSPILIPVLSVTMGLHLFMIRIGLANTFIGVTLIHLVPTVPYSIRVLHQAYKQMGAAISDQSFVLGATPLYHWFAIEAPLLKPAIRSVTFLAMVISLSQYAITAIIGGGSILTLPLIFFPFLETANTSVMAAFSMWFAFVPCFIYLIMEGLLALLPYSSRRRGYEK